MGLVFLPRVEVWEGNFKLIYKQDRLVLMYLFLYLCLCSHLLEISKVSMEILISMEKLQLGSIHNRRLSLLGGGWMMMKLLKFLWLSLSISDIFIIILSFIIFIIF
jgi:hypothetical protein